MLRFSLVNTNEKSPESYDIYYKDQCVGYIDLYSDGQLQMVLNDGRKYIVKTDQWGIFRCEDAQRRWLNRCVVEAFLMVSEEKCYDLKT